MELIELRNLNDTVDVLELYRSVFYSPFDQAISIESRKYHLITHSTDFSSEFCGVSLKEEGLNAEILMRSLFWLDNGYNNGIGA